MRINWQSVGLLAMLGVFVLALVWIANLDEETINQAARDAGYNLGAWMRGLFQ